MNAPSSPLPVILTPRLSLGSVDGREFWLTSLEVWPHHVVIRCHLLGYEFKADPPHPGSRVTWRMWVGSEELSWMSSLAGGLGAEARFEWAFRSKASLVGESTARLEWSGPEDLRGSVELILPAG